MAAARRALPWRSRRSPQPLRGTGGRAVPGPAGCSAPGGGGGLTASERARLRRRRGAARPRRAALSPGSGPELGGAGPAPSSEAGPGPPSLARRHRSGCPAGPSRPRGLPLPVGDPVRLVPWSHLSPATLPGAEEGLAAAAARVGARRGAGSILRPRRGRTGAAYPGGGRGNIPPGRAPRGGPGCMGRGRPGAAGGGSRPFLPARSAGWDGRRSRGGRGAREGAEEGPAAGRERQRQGGRAASPLPLSARPPAAAALRHRPGEAGRREPGRPPRRARPCPVSRAATDSRPAPAPTLGMYGAAAWGTRPLMGRAEPGLGFAPLGRAVPAAPASPAPRPKMAEEPRSERPSAAAEAGTRCTGRAPRSCSPPLGLLLAVPLRKQRPRLVPRKGKERRTSVRPRPENQEAAEHNRMLSRHRSGTSSFAVGKLFGLKVRDRN